MTEYNEFISCPVCLQHYEEPYVLNCLHSMCKKCLEECINRNFQVTCSLCQFHTDATNCKPDYRIKEFLDFLKPTNSKPINFSSLRRCDICDDIIDPCEVHLCKDCKDIICMSCRIVHGKGRRTKSHTVYSLNQKPPPFCKAHNKKFEFYCNESTCRSLLCVNCALVFHDGHEKRTYEEQTQMQLNEFNQTIKIVNNKLDELRYFVHYSKKCKLEVENKFVEVEAIARNRRDLIYKNAKEAYEKEVANIYTKKFEFVLKMNDSIVKLEASERILAHLLRFIQSCIDKKSYYDMFDSSSAINEILEKQCRISFPFVEVDSMQLSSEKIDENTIEKAVHACIGPFQANIIETRDSILSNKRRRQFYNSLVCPRIIGRIYSHSGLCDILYDKDSDSIYSLRSTSQSEMNFLTKYLKNGNKSELPIHNCHYTFLQNYMAFLPNGNLLMLCYSGKDVADRLITVDKNLSSAKEFVVPFCNSKDIKILCSTSCKKFVFFLSTSNIVYKYCVTSNSHEEAIVPLTTLACYMDVSANLDHIAFGSFHEIHLFSFTEKIILRSIGTAETFYWGISFLTEDILIAALKEDSLNIFNTLDGELLRTIKNVKDENSKDLEIRHPQLIRKCTDSSIIINDERTILKISL